VSNRIPRAERRSNALADLRADLSVLRDVSVKGDARQRLSLLHRILTKATTDGYYQEAMEKNATYSLETLQSAIDNLRPLIAAETLDRAWATLPSRLSAASAVAKDDLQRLHADLVKAVARGNSLCSVMGWADKHFENAAKADVYDAVAHWVGILGEKTNENGQPLTTRERFDNLYEMVVTELMAKSRWLSASTSQCTNLMENSVRVAWAAFHENRVRLECDWSL
jgi:hypothetical protein